MRRWPLFTLFLALLLLATAPVYAIPAEFTAWLYAWDTGEMVLVDLSGERERFELPIVAPYDTLPYTHVAISPNGHIMAYVITQNGTFNQQLMVYNNLTDSIIAQFPVPAGIYNSIDFGARHSFSPDSRYFAFGYSVEPEGWELQVIDLQEFSIAATARSSDPQFAGMVAHYGVTPVPSYFKSETELAFALLLGGTDAQAPAESLMWDMAANAVRDDVGYGYATDIFIPTGEAIFPMPDDRFGMSDDFIMYQANTIQVYDPAAGARWPVFEMPSWNFYQAEFVYNGRLIAALTDNNANVHVQLINRDGSINSTLDFSVSPYDLAGVPDGLVLTQFSGSTPGLYSLNLRAGDTMPSLVWSGTDNTYPRLSWVGELGSPSFEYAEPPYAPWVELASPTHDSAEAGGSLSVGGTATIATTDGDRLRVRAGAGVSFLVTRQVDAGTSVTIIGGPVSADGFTWWNIRLPDGTTGWVVDFADGLATLIPAGGGGGSSPAPTSLPSGTTPVPTATLGTDPSMVSQLFIGAAATVTTNSLRMRTIAGLTGGVLREMPRHSYVRVVGGPANFDGLIWWQIQMLDGTTGWAAEIVGTERVLTFTSAPPPAATATPAAPELTPTPTNTPGIGFTLVPITLVFIPPTPTPTLGIILIPFPTVPVQVSPADGAVLSVPSPRTTTLVWNASTHANSYEIERKWCSNTNDNCNDYSVVTTSGTSFSFDFIGAQYGRWRVRAVNTSSGFRSDWSPWFTFRHTQ